jgi:hypothetical protein
VLRFLYACKTIGAQEVVEIDLLAGVAQTVLWGLLDGIAVMEGS